MVSETKYRRDIQVIRGLAVLAVVLFHANENYFPLGYLGVDVFFVISGFVVTPLILRIFTDHANVGGGLDNLKYFYKRRFYRLAPAMLVMLSSSAILVLVLISPTSFKIFGRQAIDTIFFVGNYGAFKNVGDYFNNSGNPLLHTWSLAVEEQIYIFLPMLLFLFCSRRKNVQKIFLVTLVLITSLSLFLFMYDSIFQVFYEKIGISESKHLFFYSPFHRIWQFTLGGVSFLLFKNRVLTGVRNQYIKILPALLLSVLIFGPLSFGPVAGSFLASSITLFVISLRSLDAAPDKLTTPLAWLGDRSYSIYLFHMPLIFIANSSPYLSNHGDRGIFVTIAVILSIFLGAMNYSYVENRFRLKPSSVTKAPPALIALSSLLTLSLALSFFMIRGSANEYWGLERKTSQPPVAWNLDSECVRMSGLNDPPCLYKIEGATKTVLLIGDSQAAQFSQAIIESSKKARWNSAIWTMASCNLALSDRQGKISQLCLKRNTSILNWIKEQEPSLVIISQYNRNDLPQVEMKNAVMKIKEFVPSILVVGNTPIFSDERYMASPALFQELYQAPTRIKSSEMNNTNVAISNLFLAEMAFQGIQTVNLNSLWCSVHYCNRYDHQGWLFFDTVHLSVFGARLSEPYFTEFLNSR
jgi:peptidoglycan/LPS O-acetylase OafA/YrhL